jgi:mono/diheme cytochrome c family protein
VLPVFAEKRCGACHVSGAAKVGAPRLEQMVDTMETPLDVVTQMWNHAGRMEEKLAQANIEWAVFRGRETADLAAHLLSVRAAGRPPGGAAGGGGDGVIEAITDAARPTASGARKGARDVKHRLIGFVVVVSVVASLSTGLSDAAADLANGKKIYLNKCVGCHGASGTGDALKAGTLEKKPTNFTDKGKMGQFTDAQLKKVTLEGKPPMPGYQGKMSDKDLEDVIGYIRTFTK